MGLQLLDLDPYPDLDRDEYSTTTRETPSLQRTSLDAAIQGDLAGKANMYGQETQKGERQGGEQRTWWMRIALGPAPGTLG